MTTRPPPSPPPAPGGLGSGTAPRVPDAPARAAPALGGLVVALAVLLLLVALGYKLFTGRALHAPPAAADARPAAALRGSVAVPARASAAGQGSAPDSRTAPATPQAAADDDSALPAPRANRTGSDGPPGNTIDAATPGFAPPQARQIPDTPMGEVIRRGEQIFLQTGTHAPAFVGNSLNCANCHLDAGRKAQSAPLWGAYPLYPAYRSKTKHVDTFSERLRGCFTYSMNGKAPDPGDEVLVALEAYAYWMAQGAPIGKKLPGAGYGKLPAPAQAPDYARGQAVFAGQCALCHGADGQGQRSGNVQVFPPLWGPRSYNWGAGMHEVDKAAAFIQANMPLGRGGSLSVQDAWDVATYLNSQERPQDPRFTQDVATTRAQFHNSPYSLYGTTVNGKVLGSMR